MILSDTGFIVASISADDKYHQRCIQIAATLPPQSVTTWPRVTEAMYLLGRWDAQEKLRRQIEQGILILHTATQEHAERACALTREYADAPMDFADASLVMAAEALNANRILTFDSHFYAYRIHGRTPFEVLPQ